MVLVLKDRLGQNKSLWSNRKSPAVRSNTVIYTAGKSVYLIGQSHKRNGLIISSTRSQKTKWLMYLYFNYTSDKLRSSTEYNCYLAHPCAPHNLITSPFRNKHSVFLPSTHLHRLPEVAQFTSSTKDQGT